MELLASITGHSNFVVERAVIEPAVIVPLNKCSAAGRRSCNRTPANWGGNEANVAVSGSSLAVDVLK
jgi:hypothetical protein